MTQPCITETLYPTETFKYNGREYRLYKRTAGKNGSWYFQIERRGRRYPTSLKTAAVQAAIAAAKLLIDAAQQNKLEKIRAILAGRDEKDTREFCAVEKYLQRYENTPTGENTARSRHHFVLAFRRLMARASAPPTRMDQLAPMFKEARSHANAAAEAAPDNATRMRIKRSFNSEVSNAASVFAGMSAFALKDQLTLPDFTELRQLVKFIRFNDAKKTASQYNPPPAAVLAATLAGWRELPRNEFIAVGLALACGMRRGEIRDFADWSWFEPHGGYLWCNARQGNFKDRTDVLRAQVLNPFWEIFRDHCTANGWMATSGRCITGNRSEFDKNISSWMIQLGWETRLHLHSLRAWAGSLVYMKYGSRAASEFCRHADEKTTKEHYGWMRSEWHTDDAPVLIASQPVEWVKI